MFAKWQLEMEGKGWNSLFWNNHDLPRIVSRWGNDGEYRVESAKMLATALHGMKGTPYIYQGEEIGMTNVPIDSVDDLADIESVNMYHERMEAGYAKEDILNSLRGRARDNARTPMQWDDSHAAGFTTGAPWYRVNPNYTDINVKQALQDKNSVFYYYQKLISFRKNEKILLEGDFSLLCPEDPAVFAYTRSLENKTWIILCNFFEEKAEYTGKGCGKVLLSNYEQPEMIAFDKMILRPYEAMIVEVQK